MPVRSVQLYAYKNKLLQRNNFQRFLVLLRPSELRGTNVSSEPPQAKPAVQARLPKSPFLHAERLGIRADTNYTPGRGVFYLPAAG